MNPGSPPKPPRLRLRVTAAAESVLRSGHPWLFAESIKEQNRAGELGELAVIYDRKNKFLAAGLFDPHSPIRVRILRAGKPQTLDRKWWQARLDQALARRRGLFDRQTTGWRCLNGESDGWPGLVLDRYNDTLVLKLYTAAWLPRLDEVIDLLRGKDRRSHSNNLVHEFPEAPLSPSPSRSGGEGRGGVVIPHPMLLELLPTEPRLVLRLSRNIQQLAGSQFHKHDGQILHGAPLTSPVVFLETGLRFEADVLRGQKTGFFLDQRDNRRRVEALAGDRRVLNAFSFSGGFSLYAARGGARSVTDLDISPHALQSAARNFALNQSHPAIAACRHETAQADAFEWLEQTKSENFDLIILDPPSLAKRETEKAGALRAYGRLAALATGCLRAGGILVAASCSARVTADEFFQVIRQSAARSRRQFSELQTTGHPPDHPAAFREAEYLKAIYLKFS